MNQSDHFLRITEDARNRIEVRLRTLVPESPRSLYDPIRYALESGGKYIRPILTYLASQSGHEVDWIPAACAVELLHDFTLVHDDIMDNASTRRGKPTVHRHYDVNTAILAGDAIISLAEESLASGKYELSNQMMSEFALGFRSVCEGQAYDKEYESRADVTTQEYLRMIDLKTAKMLELAAVLGAYAAGGKYVEDIRMFAHHTGIAFQIRDDLLDITADQMNFGKTIGGDILEGKRTFLYLGATECFDTLDPEDQNILIRIRDRKATHDDIPRVKKLFSEAGVIEKARKAIEEETMNARNNLKNLPSTDLRDGLMQFGEYLLGRLY